MKTNYFLAAGLLCATATGLPCCQAGPTDEREAAGLQAAAFADHYYNYEFDEAAKRCTPESRRWIAWRATNLTERDMETLNAHPERAVAEATGVELGTDSTAYATCRISHVWLADSLERPPYLREQTECKLLIVKREGKWLVKMEGPLRSGK